MFKFSFIILISIFFQTSFGIENKLISKTITGEGSVEAEPGKFISYNEHMINWDYKHTSFVAVHTMEAPKAKFFQRNTTYLAIPWKGEDVSWVGFGVPIVIRANADLLYLVVFDRETDFSKIRFSYFKQHFSTLEEIRPSEFPKSLAIQNLWLRKENGFGADGKPVNEIEIAKNLDPENLYFPSSLTAKMWMQLEAGKEYYEIQNESIPKDFLKQYLQKYNPPKLLTIVK
jgi:hypothetical protein